jgi:hypothetical protein
MEDCMGRVAAMSQEAFVYLIKPMLVSSLTSRYMLARVLTEASHRGKAHDVPGRILRGPDELRVSLE